VSIEDWQSRGCSKAGLSTFDDLVPDLPAYLEYQARGGNRAYPSPGLSPPIDEDGDILDPAEGEQPNLNQPQRLTTGAGYQLARSVVVVFTHKGLLAERVLPIRSLVREINQQGRPVIVIFMPATYTDSATYGNFCAALDLEPDCTSSENSNLNSFFFLSPFNSDYGTYYSHAAPDITREEHRAFSLYWSDLMSDLPSVTDDPFYLDIARSIFVEKILKLEPKL
jgi:hypothetical protein